MNWLEDIIEHNQAFCQGIEPGNLPVQRQPCPYAVITCMDPRINLEALGILPFQKNGQLQSPVRIIRTLGGIAEDRSLLAGIHMAGFNEIAVVMHTDCGCCLATVKAPQIIENMQTCLTDAQLDQFEQYHNRLETQAMQAYLNTFENPLEAVKKQVNAIKQKSFVPHSIIVHGLVYSLVTGKLEIVVNGYD